MSNKGFTLIEVMVSLSIFSMLFLFALTIQIDNAKIKGYNNKLNENINFYEALKNDLIGNISFSKLKVYTGKTIYLDKEEMNLKFLKDNYDKIIDSFSEEAKTTDFIELQVIDSAPVLKLELRMQINYNADTENMDFEFYKGDY